MINFKLINEKINELINFNASRYRLNEEINNFARQIKNGSRVLDAGAGDCKYKIHFVTHDYISVDFCKVEKPYADLDYVSDLNALPFEDNYFDAILFSQVLEHIPDPKKVLNELQRVLKPGGLIFCSTPFIYHEHEIPYDFFRYTSYGLINLFKEAGFHVVKIERLEGYMAFIGYVLRDIYYNIAENLTRGAKRKILKLIFFPVKFLSLIFNLFDLIIKIDAKLHKNYFLTARK